MAVLKQRFKWRELATMLEVIAQYFQDIAHALRLRSDDDRDRTHAHSRANVDRSKSACSGVSARGSRVVGGGAEM